MRLLVVLSTLYAGMSLCAQVQNFEFNLPVDNQSPQEQAIYIKKAVIQTVHNICSSSLSINQQHKLQQALQNPLRYVHKIAHTSYHDQKINLELHLDPNSLQELFDHIDCFQASTMPHHHFLWLSPHLPQTLFDAWLKHAHQVGTDSLAIRGPHPADYRFQPSPHTITLTAIEQSYHPASIIKIFPSETQADIILWERFQKNTKISEGQIDRNDLYADLDGKLIQHILNQELSQLSTIGQTIHIEGIQRSQQIQQIKQWLHKLDPESQLQLILWQAQQLTVIWHSQNTEARQKITQGPLEKAATTSHEKIIKLRWRDEP